MNLTDLKGNLIGAQTVGFQMLIQNTMCRVIAVLAFTDQVIAATTVNIIRFNADGSRNLDDAAMDKFLKTMTREEHAGIEDRLTVLVNEYSVNKFTPDFAKNRARLFMDNQYKE